MFENWVLRTKDRYEEDSENYMMKNFIIYTFHQLLQGYVRVAYCDTTTERRNSPLGLGPENESAGEGHQQL
jgi:hypothetical protein